MELSITNSTGLYSSDQIYFYVIGLNSDGCFSHLTSDGTLQACATSDNSHDGYTDYSINLAATSSLTLPEMSSGQIYISINDKLKIKVNADPNQPCGIGLALPSGWTSTDPNYNILYGVVEFTYNSGGMNCDTTCVDMFSIPIEIQLIGQSNQTAGALVPGGRSSIYTAVKGNSDFAGLVIGDDLRVIAPGHGIDSQLFSSTYLDSYIDSCWTYYQQNPITVIVGSTSYTGQVDANGLFQFPAQTGTLGSLKKPTTQDVFYCNGALNAPNNEWGAVVARIAASLNRAVLLNSTTQPVCTASEFYITSPPNSPTNYYSQILHANSVNNTCYGFAFDDVCSLYSSDIADPAPTNFNLTLTAF